MQHRREIFNAMHFSQAFRVALRNVSESQELVVIQRKALRSRARRLVGPEEDNFIVGQGEELVGVFLGKKGYEFVREGFLKLFDALIFCK